MDETNYSVYVVIVEDTESAFERMTEGIEQYDEVKQSITWEEAEQLQLELANFGRFIPTGTT